MKRKEDDAVEAPSSFVHRGSNYGQIAGRDMQVGDVSIGVPREDPPEEAVAEAESRRVSILFLGANPDNTTKIHLDREVRSVDEALRKAELGAVFDLQQCWAVQAGDLQDCLLRYRPQVVHFAGHGEEGCLIFEDDRGGSKTVPASALARLFKGFRDQVRCVVLNCCCSMEQARAIATQIECVVGMSQPVSDDAALAFSAGFYRGLAAGGSLQASFERGCVEVELRDAGDGDVPEILWESRDPEEIVLA